MRPALLAVAVLVVALPGAAQQPRRTITRPDAEFAQPFTRVSGVRELRDGRVLVSDSRDKTIQVIDFKTGAATAISRAGSGPGEYNLPNRLLALGPDSTAMVDARNGRVLLLGADGTPAGTVPLGRTVDVYSARYADARGNLYVEGNPRATGPGTFADSAPVIRYSIFTAATDTIAMIRVPKIDMSTWSGNGMSGFRTEEVPFGVHDDWAVFPDGRLAIARGADYHLDFVSSKRARTSGPKTPFTPIAVTAADKDSVRNARKLPPGQQAPRVPLILEPSVWYPTKAPFGESSTWAGPDGMVWVQVARRAGDPPTFDLFDAAGRRQATVIIPAGIRVAGFGAHALYGIRTDADDEQYLQRYDLKPPGHH